MFSYTAYGLGIQSEIRLSALQEASVAGDVEIRRGDVSLPAAAIGRKAWFTAAEAYLRFPNVGVIRVAQGREVIVDMQSGANEREAEVFLLGPALGVLLHQRGFLVLHASAVAINGGVVAFLGMSGWGKSTMAAALSKRYRLFADDIVAVSIDQGRVAAFPGFPRLKLGLDSVQTLGYSGRRFRKLSPDDERRDIPVKGASPGVSRPLERVYVLAEGEVPAVESLAPQEAAVELIRHSYAAPCLRASQTLAAHVRQCAALVDSLTVCRLRRPVQLQLVGEVAKLVERDLAMHRKARSGAPPESRTC